MKNRLFLWFATLFGVLSQWLVARAKNSDAPVTWEGVKAAVNTTISSSVDMHEFWKGEALDLKARLLAQADELPSWIVSEVTQMIQRATAISPTTPKYELPLDWPAAQPNAPRILVPTLRDKLNSWILQLGQEAQPTQVPGELTYPSSTVLLAALQSLLEEDASDTKTVVFDQVLSDFFWSCYETSRSKGWWDGVPYKDPSDENSPRVYTPELELTKHFLLISEVAESGEEIRKGADNFFVYYSPEGKPEGVLIELADVFIRLGDYLASKGASRQFAEAVRIKAAYNLTRPHRHGGKTA